MRALSHAPTMRRQRCSGSVCWARKGFTDANHLPLTEATEARLEAALEAGDSLDARLVLLALHAGVIQAQVVERYQLEAI